MTAPQQSRRAYLIAIGTTPFMTGCLRLSEDSRENSSQESIDDTSSQGPPSVQFTADYDESADELTITHTAGESIDADRVTIEGAAGDWETETISAGDSVTVSPEGAAALTVVWTSERGSSAELFRTDVSG